MTVCNDGSLKVIENVVLDLSCTLLQTAEKIESCPHNTNLFYSHFDFWAKKFGPSVNKCLQEIFDDICKNINGHLDDHAFDNSLRSITVRSAFNEVLNDELELRNGVVLCFHKNSDFVSNIMIVTFVFSGIVENVHGQSATSSELFNATRCISRSLNVRFDGSLDSDCFISVLLKLVALSFIRILWNATF